MGNSTIMTATTQNDLKQDMIKKLDEFEASLGLPENVAPGEMEELQSYLTMSKDLIESFTPQRLISISIRLSQYSFYLQRCINKSKAIKTWATHQITRIASTEMLQHDKYLKHEIKLSLISQTNEAVKHLSIIIRDQEQIIDRLYDLSNNIRNLSYVFSLESKAKLGDRSE